MFSFFPLPILFLLLQNIGIYSTNRIEEKRRQHTELEAEIRRLFKQRQDFIPAVFQFTDDEILCKCNHYMVCGEEDVGNYVDNKFMGVCRPGRSGVCSRVVFFNSDGTIREVVTSCLKREQLVPRELPFVCQNSKTERWHQIVNCCKTSFCNDIELPIELGDDGFPLLMLLLCLVLVLFLFAIGFGVALFCCFPKKRAFFDRWLGWLVQCRTPTLDRSTGWSPTRSLTRENISESLERIDPETLVKPLWGSERINSSKVDCDMDSEGGYGDNESDCSSIVDRRLVDEGTFSTGSGAGVPMLAPRSMARQVVIKGSLGKGGFGDVKLGEWRGEKVAVKVFDSQKIISFDRETDIYRSRSLRHPNILRWIMSDTKDTGNSIEHWLVTEYCPNRSLLDHLEKNTLTVQLCLQFIRSIANGLDYLHTELPGASKKYHKPAIAHRDLKPGNILIKNDWTCCIADLGMCIRLLHNGVIDKPEGGDRGGTARYLAPEFLAKTYNNKSFTSYLLMDIYALALVIWEICCRVEVNGLVPAFDYTIPYHDCVSRGPVPDKLKQFVCDEGRRPPIPEEWLKSTVLKELSRVIQESWNAIPQSRLTALTIRCTMDKICEEENIFIIT